MDVTDQDSISRARLYSNTRKKIGCFNLQCCYGGITASGSVIGKSEGVKGCFETNFFAAIKVTQKFPPLLMKATQPRVVNVFSELGSLSIVFHMQDKGHYPDGLCPAY
jgi:short-subunit dehydrogenase involved in D-alanine esterification of teichoic acids